MLLAERAVVAARLQVEMEMQLVIGIAAGTEHRLERPAGGGPHLVEEFPLLFRRLGADIDARVVGERERSDVERIAIGDTAHFFPETPGSGRLELTVSGIDKDATRVLPEAMLAFDHGGDVMVRARNGQLVPDRAVYRVTLSMQEGERPEALQVVRGRTVIFGAPKSLLGEFLRSALALALRESGW